ncbi:MAG TPA: 7-cyano-7-deazaguanine synthase [Candidatus Binatia bacterium]|nr:7-cyano-7-deazaguanine synthase [Candidatus Binatia bacterium]
MRSPVGVLCSGGLDSAVLLVDLARRTGRVVPLFVRAGHPWEDAERAALGRFLEAVAEPRIAPVRELLMPMQDLYRDHWSVTGEGAPGWDAPDEAVELRGRNLVLLSKALVAAAIEGWPTVAMGSLAGNPFPDATPRFFAAIAATASEALGASLEVVAPYRDLSKVDVIRRAADLPLELTLSCLRPTSDGRHCGDCNKCRERAEAFAVAGVPDRTVYARHDHATDQSAFVGGPPPEKGS